MYSHATILQQPCNIPTTMEHGSGKHVMDTKVTVKIEVEVAVPSKEIHAIYIKEEPGLGQSVKSEPASLVKEDIPGDCTQGTSAPAYAGSGNEACSKSLGDLLIVKDEPSDMDIGPTVLQHMDTIYKINQNKSAVKEENTIADDCGAAIPCKRRKKESLEDKLRGEWRGVPATATRATDRTHVARDIGERQMKEEDADLDIGPTVLQHMDSHYRADQIHTATLPICYEEADGILTPRPARTLTSPPPPSVRPCSGSWSPQPGTSQLTTPRGQECERRSPQHEIDGGKGAGDGMVTDARVGKNDHLKMDFTEHSELVYQGDRIHCVICNVRLKPKKYNVVKHLKSKAHEEKLCGSYSHIVYLIKDDPTFEMKESKIYCTSCNCLIHPSKFSLDRHVETYKHQGCTTGV